MEIKLQTSAIQRRILDQTGIHSVEELMYADLRRSGWDKADAFYAAFRHLYSGYKINDQKRIMAQMESDPAIKRRIAGLEKDKTKISGEELALETSKEKILSDLILARKTMKTGSKEWVDITAKIADYTKIKQDDIKVDEKPIRFHLPVHYPKSCKDCLIYQNGKQIKK